jgi:hypothetical protein
MLSKLLSKTLEVALTTANAASRATLTCRKFAKASLPSVRGVLRRLQEVLGNVALVPINVKRAAD